MIKKVVHSIVFSLVLVLIGTLGGKAQSALPGDRDEAGGRQQDPKPNLMRQLGLSRQQMQQIRQFNTRRRPMMEAAQQRLREANRKLDAAIYADELNETDVQERIKELQLSQAEIIRIRWMNELAIRKILTPDQLVKFRRMRQRFDAARSRGDRQAVNQDIDGIM